MLTAASCLPLLQDALGHRLLGSVWLMAKLLWKLSLIKPPDSISRWPLPSIKEWETPVCFLLSGMSVFPRAGIKLSLPCSVLRGEPLFAVMQILLLRSLHSDSKDQPSFRALKSSLHFMDLLKLFNVPKTISTSLYKA